MPLEVGLWRVDGGKPVKVTATGVPLESQLETMIEADPTILGTPLLLVGRQVPTDYGTFIDLLAVDDEGALHVLELKRDRTPREVVAQVLDYGSWVRTLSHAQVLEIFTAYKPGVAFEQEWTATFGGDAPEELNGGHRLTIVAGDVDPATERIIGYLTDLGVPVNVVFFRYFDDGDRAYLARTWLIDEARTPPRTGSTSRGGTREPWNELDWYVSFGEESGNRDWDDARRYGFVSAGGGEWFSRTLRKLPVGGRVFACIPGVGYVGVGTVTGEAQPFEEAVVEVDGQSVRLADQPLRAAYQHGPLPTGEDHREYIVPVTWQQTRPRSEPYWVKGMFANQNSACKLRNRFTLEQLATAFDLGD
ncbi:endonuclease NucS domain-containing protein [Geodermatophilus sp. SYSU D00708]